MKQYVKTMCIREPKIRTLRVFKVFEYIYTRNEDKVNQSIAVSKF